MDVTIGLFVAVFTKPLYCRLESVLFWNNPTAFKKLSFNVLYVSCFYHNICMCGIIAIVVPVSSPMYVTRGVLSVSMTGRFVLLVLNVCVGF